MNNTTSNHGQDDKQDAGAPERPTDVGSHEPEIELKSDNIRAMNRPSKSAPTTTDREPIDGGWGAGTN